MWRYYWRIIKFTHCKWTVQLFLINSYSWATTHHNPVLEHFCPLPFPLALSVNICLFYWNIIEYSETAGYLVYELSTNFAYYDTEPFSHPGDCPVLLVNQHPYPPPPPKQTLIWIASLQVLKSHINGITPYILSFSIMFLKLIHVVSCTNSLLLFSLLSIFPSYDTCLFILCWWNLDFFSNFGNYE